MTRHWQLWQAMFCAWFHGVMVSTLDSESSDPSSSLGGTCQCFVSLFSPGKYCLPIDKISLTYFISCKSAFGWGGRSEIPFWFNGVHFIWKKRSIRSKLSTSARRQKPCTLLRLENKKLIKTNNDSFNKVYFQCTLKEYLKLFNISVGNKLI